MFGESGKSIEVGRSCLANPDDGFVSQALAYDGFIGLPRFRSDALILEGTCHLGATPLRAQLALPYWPATDDRRLTLHDFRLLEFSGDETARERLRAGLFSRLNAAENPDSSTRESAEERAGGLWRTYYTHEDDEAHLAARRAALPPLPWEGATPEAEEEHSEVVSLDDFNAADWQSELPDAESQAKRMRAAMDSGFSRIPGRIGLPGLPTSKDPLAESICNFPALLREGRVVWGVLLRANFELFKHDGDDDYPVEAVYCIDGSVQPDVLQSVAIALSALTKQLPPQADEALKKLADHLNNDSERAFGWPVPASLAPAPGLPDRLPDTLRISALWVVRNHLPHGYLVGNVLPLLMSDACPGHVMVVPDRAWPAAFRAPWDRAFEEVLRERWQTLWQALAAGESKEDADSLAKARGLLADYAECGEDVAEFQEQARKGYAALFAPDVKLPPMEWECERCSWLSSYAELLLRKAESLRAQERPLAHGLIRQAFSARATYMLIKMHTTMLERLRGKSKMRLPIEPGEVRYAALGLLTGAETHALTLARLLIALWRDPDNYDRTLRPEVWFLFRLFARHLNLELPERKPFRRRPCLDALLENDAWKGESARVKPMLEAACVEHTVLAPQGPFLGLPVALAAILRLRELAGLPNPRLEHDLLRVELGAPPPAPPVPADFGAASDLLADPLTLRVRQRMRRMGFDEKIIAEAVLNDQPPRMALEAAPQPREDMDDNSAGEESDAGKGGWKWLKWPRRPK
jgi:hypothetical protein